MTNPLQIGVTGGIGSGKSMVCKIFSQLGVPTYNADDRAKWLMSNDLKLKKALSEVFGPDTFTRDGSLNRNYLAAEVFGNTSLLNKLNGLVHPRVGQDYEEWVKRNRTVDYLVKEAALMFQSGAYRTLDKIITVVAPDDIRLQRTMKRDPFRSEEEVRSIMQSQIINDETLKMSDYIVRNDGTELLIPQVLRLHQMFSQDRSVFN